MWPALPTLYIIAGCVVWVAVVALFALLLGFNDHPPARGLLRRSHSPNPSPRL